MGIFMQRYFEAVSSRVEKIGLKWSKMYHLRDYVIHLLE